MATDPPRVPLRDEPATFGTRISKATLVLLLLTGGVVGYFLGLPTQTSGRPVADVPPTTDSSPNAAAAAAATPAGYDWLEQQPSDSVQQAWGIFAAVELDNALFLLVFANVDAPENRVLWRSVDGNDWAEIQLDLGNAIVDDVDVYEDSLLLSGWLDGAPAVWRSEPSPTTDPSWQVTRLEARDESLGDIRFLDSAVQTEINTAGEIVVSVRTQSDITPLLLDFVHESAVDVDPQLLEPPDVAARGQRIWAEVFSANGDGSVHSIELPMTRILEPTAGRYVIDVGLVTYGSLWASDNGTDFTPADLSNLPRPLTPYALRDSFVGVVEDSAGHHSLWTSHDGRVWEQSSLVTPAECGSWANMVVGGPGMLVIGEAFETTCLSPDGKEWEIRQSPQMTLPTPGQFWADGTASGFVALVRNSSDLSVLISADGHDWRPVEFANGLLGTHAFLVNDRLVTNAMSYGPPPQGRRFSVWVGTPAAG